MQIANAKIRAAKAKMNGKDEVKESDEEKHTSDTSLPEVRRRFWYKNWKELTRIEN